MSSLTSTSCWLLCLNEVVIFYVNTDNFVGRMSDDFIRERLEYIDNPAVFILCSREDYLWFRYVQLILLWEAIIQREDLEH